MSFYKGYRSDFPLPGGPAGDPINHPRPGVPRHQVLMQSRGFLPQGFSSAFSALEQAMVCMEETFDREINGTDFPIAASATATTSPVFQFGWAAPAAPEERVTDHFDLQQLSGVDSEATEQPDECIVCATNKKKVAFVPCGHRSTCIGCAKLLAKPECPCCRAKITGALVVFDI